MEDNKHSVVLFDGVCNFCNSSVNFIMDRDKNDRFRFAALQSDAGTDLQKQYGLDPNELSSFILVEDGRYFTKTTAALRVGKHLGFPWNLFYPLIFIPPFLRNISYNIIASYRYKWFGKKDACRLPTAEERARFL
jgi:predicted DCC family thiol-disulfide oxidoreductase YuxK